MDEPEILSDLRIELELDPSLAAMRGEVESEMLGAVRQSAFELRDAIADDLGLSIGPAPPGRPPATDTGELVESITVALDSDGLGAVVGVGAPYAQYLEFGTLQMPARPFLFPAFERMEERIVRNITVAGARALRRRGVRVGV